MEQKTAAKHERKTQVCEGTCFEIDLKPRLQKLYSNHLQVALTLHKYMFPQDEGKLVTLHNLQQRTLHV